AMQEGRYVAKVVRDRLRGRDTPPFRYHDKGDLATIGRSAAVADIKGLKLSGFIAWALWLVVHLWYLVGFANRILVFTRWSISFLTQGRGARLITGGAIDVGLDGTDRDSIDTQASSASRAPAPEH